MSIHRSPPRTSLGIPRTPKPRVQLLLFFVYIPPPSTPATKKHNQKTFLSRFGRENDEKDDFHPRQNLQVLLDMLNVQVLASPVLGFGPKRSTQMDFEASQGFGGFKHLALQPQRFFKYVCRKTLENTNFFSILERPFWIRVSF